MTKMFKKMRKLMAETKVRVQRSMSYVSIVNSGMILFLMLTRLEDFGIDIKLTQWFFPLFVISIFGAILLGHIDIKLGFFSEESGAVAKRNPVLSDIQNRLQNIETKLNDIKK